MLANDFPKMPHYLTNLLAAAVIAAVLAGCGGVAAPPQRAAAPPPPPPPAAPEPEPEQPPPPPEIPPGLIAKLAELRRLAEEIKTQPAPTFNVDDLDGLEQQVTVLAERQTRLSALAQEILAGHAALTPEQRAVFEREHLTDALRTVVPLPPAEASEAPAAAP